MINEVDNIRCYGRQCENFNSKVGESSHAKLLTKGDGNEL